MRTGKPFTKTNPSTERVRWGGTNRIGKAVAGGATMYHYVSGGTQSILAVCLVRQIAPLGMFAFALK